MDRAWGVYSPRGQKESDVTEQLMLSLFHFHMSDTDVFY